MSSTGPGRLSSAANRPMTWHAEAQATTGEILRFQVRQLYDEAERVASRLDADCVGPKHVATAAKALSMGRTGTALFDTLQAAGTTVLGLGGGGLFTSLAVPAGSNLPGWIEPLSWILLVAGGILSASGMTGKLTRR